MTKEIPLPLDIDNEPVGHAVDVLIERLIFKDAHWVQGWDVYREVPEFSTDDSHALLVLETARVHIKRWLEGTTGTDHNLPDFTIKSWADGYLVSVGVFAPATWAKTLAEAVCKAAYKEVAAHVLKEGRD